MPIDLDAALAIARHAADAGAEIAMRHRKSHKHLIVEAKAPADFVTDVDKEAQATIIGNIRETFPDHRILANPRGPVRGVASTAPIFEELRK